MLKIIGYDKGGNIKAEINGEPYKFATAEFYGQVVVYGVAFPNDNFFTSFSRSKKAEKFYRAFAEEISEYIKTNPDNQE